MSAAAEDGDYLKRAVARVEALEAEIAELRSEIAGEYEALRAKGYHVKPVRRIVRERRGDQAARAEEEALLEVYRDALGMGGAPLGDYANRAA